MTSLPRFIEVSIHAPARGATYQITDYRESQAFQSTPLREGRPKIRIRYLTGLSFNPRPCARGDNAVLIRVTAIDVSIHAPARGATLLGGWIKSQG